MKGIPFEQLLKNAQREASKFRGEATPNFKKIEQIFLVSGNSEYLARFGALNLEGTDFKAVENALVEAFCMKDLCYFAKHCKYANIERICDVVVSSNSAEWNFYCAENFKKAPVKKHEQVVLTAGEAKWNYFFARDIKGAQIGKHFMSIVLNAPQSEWHKDFVQDMYIEK